MKKLFLLLLAAVMVFSLAACGKKTDTPSGGGSAPGSTAPSGGAVFASAEGYDAEFDVIVGYEDEWAPFPGKSGVTFANSENGVISVTDDGQAVKFTGLAVGESVITATSGAELKALVRVTAAPAKAEAWRLAITDTETIDALGVAKVDYDLDLQATHTGQDMFGEYTGELTMKYSADLDGLIELMTMMGGSADYDADGWFTISDFKMDLTPFSQEAKDSFDDELMSGSSEQEQAVMDAYLNEIGSGEESFEKSSAPAGFWHDWTFHFTSGKTSEYISFTNIFYGMFTGGGSTPDATRDCPYMVEVYETGEAVFTLRTLNSPVMVKFYGIIEKI